MAKYLFRREIVLAESWEHVIELPDNPADDDWDAAWEQFAQHCMTTDPEVSEVPEMYYSDADPIAEEVSQ